MKIVTGYTGEAHVTSDDMSAFQAGLVGIGDFALTNGSDFTATAISGDEIQLTKAEIVIQGTHARVEGDEVLTLDAGTAGMYRCDLVVARYSKTAEGVESVDVDVVTGTPGTQADVLPELTQEDIRSGGETREVALFKVQLYGYTIESIEKVITTVDPIAVIQAALAVNIDRATANANNIQTLTGNYNTMISDVNALKKKQDFASPLRAITTHAKAALKSWVSAYNSSGNPSTLGAGLYCQDANGTDLASLRLYSNGRLSIYKGNTGHGIPVIKTGTVSIKPKSANVNKTATVSFGVKFASAPVIMTTPITSYPAKVHTSVTDRTRSGCKINLTRNNTSATTVMWVAIGYL